MSLLTSLMDALVHYLWPWIMAQILGLLLGFVFLETPYGASSIREQLHRSLQIAAAIFAAASAGSWLFTEERGTRLPAFIAIIAFAALQSTLLWAIGRQLPRKRHPIR